MSRPVNPPPHISPALLRWFTWYTRRFAAKHLHSIRIAPFDPAAVTGPAVVCLNHPSWWDPIVCLQLAQMLFPERKHFAPMDANSLQRYRFFSRLGFFPAQPASYSGARHFLKTANAVLSHDDALLWVTAQGRFADVRERPLSLLPGVAHLARSQNFSVLPLALEYRLGAERSPDAYARFGEPFHARDDEETLETELARCMDELSRDVISGRADQYSSLLKGSKGIGGVYAAWQAIRERDPRATFRMQPNHNVQREQA